MPSVPLKRKPERSSQMKRGSPLQHVTWTILFCCLSFFAGACGSDGPVSSATEGRSRRDYSDRLRAMWLAECIANWTGLVTESVCKGPPFFTDEDWTTRQGRPLMNGGWINFVFQDPWGSDDDTDIEYIYLDTMAGLGRTRLDPEEIRDAWIAHIEPRENVWVSNNEAHQLMLATRYALPPSTSFLAANDQSLMIDAQLTTEFFGALAPGMPAAALEIADLPIRVTASGYAAHASQFYVALYSLAAVTDPSRPVRDRILWMVEAARRLIPDTSKTADVIDFVLQDYLDNPDVDDWERTRDAVAARYQLEDQANGFKYLNYYESPVNLATGLIALLYGQGHIPRTIQIGTLSGWDCDNGTATVSGLLGLMLGTEAVAAAFPDVELSDDYDILRTRIGFNPPHCVDGHPNCLDTFTDMAERMLPLVEKEIVAGGGSVDNRTGSWILPRVDYSELSVNENPLSRLDATSANNRLLRNGDMPRVSWSGVSCVISGPTGTQGSEVADGLEYDFSGKDRRLPVRGTLPMFFGLPGKRYSALALPASDKRGIEVSVTWKSTMQLQGLRFIEGEHVLDIPGKQVTGGFGTLIAEVRTAGAWVAVENPPVTGAPNPSISHEIVEWVFDSPIPATGLRLRGLLLEDARFAAVAELEGILP